MSKTEGSITPDLPEWALPPEGREETAEEWSVRGRRIFAYLKGDGRMRCAPFHVTWSGSLRYKRVECKDGFNMSVQAHDGAYCTPRWTNTGPYVSVEVGFPSEYEPLLREYVDGDPYDIDRQGEDGRAWWTKNVYGWVPSRVVLKVILKHGGMESGELPDMKWGKDAEV
jgi:hypothetical protein